MRGRPSAFSRAVVQEHALLDTVEQPTQALLEVGVAALANPPLSTSSRRYG
ncbi:hypothetical protein [Actinoallomurus acaciae]|uniref:Uncharacterized protein n=1 Tax=Actinoallomurus acaciae TaxID=502577 RepID=A0ABV5YVY5_9ACTN